jgi:hypothetical protein
VLRRAHGTLRRRGVRCVSAPRSVVCAAAYCRPSDRRGTRGAGSNGFTIAGLPTSSPTAGVDTPFTVHVCPAVRACVRACVLCACVWPHTRCEQRNPPPVLEYVVLYGRPPHPVPTHIHTDRGPDGARHDRLLEITATLLVKMHKFLSSSAREVGAGRVSGAGVGAGRTLSSVLY